MKQGPVAKMTPLCTLEKPSAFPAKKSGFDTVPIITRATLETVENSNAVNYDW